jgi:4'-phosphopantetheinyl transferase
MLFNQVPPADFSLKEHAVHLWLLDREKALAYADLLFPLLAEDEKDRAAHFVRQKLSRLYIIIRGALRLLLSRYLYVRPDLVRFAYHEFGKPGIDAGHHHKKIEFNLSHSGTYALFAFSQGNSVGIDIEEKKPLQDIEALSRIVFPDTVQSLLSNATFEERVECFYGLWTRLEALIKAAGLGIGAYKKDLLPDVTGASPFTCRFMNQPWTVYDLFIAKTYSAAVCMQGDSHAVTGYLLDNEILQAYVREAAHPVPQGDY